ncbi:MAG: bifunctional pantoate--beta-alanine ligase/(d)CMP kinase [Crocosphaera sp.]|nr:bifunctional pantoate--beta-alanine ligase/(d)CMP kinase [Crocosphaera sp.]
MRLFKTVTGLRTYLASVRGSQTIGLVPTMGALHQGHISLIRRAVSEAGIVVVSIFVNPLQFSPNEDLAQYPRQLETDLQLCQGLGVGVVFAPTPEEMGIKPSQESTQVLPPALMLSGLCAPFRPGHFPGVATIVAKLLNIVSPDVAYFGKKDAQQLAIIRRLVKDLNFPVVVKGCPIVRETSGLACSSRNQYLSEVEKQQAIALYQSLKLAKEAFMAGERKTQVLIDLVKEKLTLSAGVMVQYVECAHPQTLSPLKMIEEAGLLAIAAHVGSTRLIDNVILSVRQPIIAIDGPAGAGKSTVTRQVADALNFTYLDTGAMYRAIAWLILQSGISVTDESAIAELVSQATLEFLPTQQDQPPQIVINGNNVTTAIRTPEVTAVVSQISAQRTVREQLVAYQQELGRIGGIVAEGRDIGTNVFPNAEVKIFLTASTQERARRRLRDFQAQGRDNIDLQKLEQEIEQRDYHDSNRTLAPLRKAMDAIEINTDGLTIEEVIDKILQVCVTAVPVLQKQL